MHFAMLFRPVTSAAGATDIILLALNSCAEIEEGVARLHSKVTGLSSIRYVQTEAHCTTYLHIGTCQACFKFDNMMNF